MDNSGHRELTDQPYLGPPRVFIGELTAYLKSSVAEQYLHEARLSDFDCSWAGSFDELAFPIAECCRIDMALSKADMFFATSYEFLVSLRADCDEMLLHFGIQLPESDNETQDFEDDWVDTIQLPFRLIYNLKRTRTLVHFE